ncbi:hypothetical protein [Paraburkholderia sp. SIMBA_054]|uniref:hypothetical protein n=1 Tax=Paraburkholderia sp. SIMBA_054 TaxID=3085795 RepID=UPI003977E620
MCAICNFKIEFSVGHPLALSVAVASRKAIEAGLIGELDVDDGPLSAARKRISAVDALNLLQAQFEVSLTTGELLALPDFYVLLIEDDTWGFFHPTMDGFDPDIVPEMPDLTTADELKRSNVVVTSQAALRAWLSGAFDIENALRDSVFVIDAPSSHHTSLVQMFVTAGSVAVSSN